MCASYKCKLGFSSSRRRCNEAGCVEVWRSLHRFRARAYVDAVGGDRPEQFGPNLPSSGRSINDRSTTHTHAQYPISASPKHPSIHDSHPVPRVLLVGSTFFFAGRVRATRGASTSATKSRSVDRSTSSSTAPLIPSLIKLDQHHLID